MAVCARAVQYTGPDVDGSPVYLLALDPAHKDLSTCPYVVDDGASNAWRELGNMSIADAQVIGSYIGAVWAIAWGFKALRRAVSSTTSESES